MKHPLILILFLTAVTLTAQAQTSKKKKTRKESTSQESGPTTLDPFYQPKTFEPKKDTKKKGGPTYDSQREFEDRMQARAKTNRRNERWMSKPQYSDPSYFGHKNPPKKHKPGKMKFCKECGLKH